MSSGPHYNKIYRHVMDSIIGYIFIFRPTGQSYIIILHYTVFVIIVGHRASGKQRNTRPFGLYNNIGVGIKEHEREDHHHRHASRNMRIVILWWRHDVNHSSAIIKLRDKTPPLYRRLALLNNIRNTFVRRFEEKPCSWHVYTLHSLLE